MSVADIDPDDLGDVRHMLGRLEAKLDVALAQHGARLDEHGRRIDDHETRLRDVERHGVNRSTTDNHEARLQTVEKTAVSRPAVIAFTATAAAVVGAVLAVTDRLTS